jgi:SAM-dependent methyltransferase
VGTRAAALTEMTTSSAIGPAAAAAGSNPEAAGVLELRHPTDRSRTVRWTGEAFDVDGNAVRVLSLRATRSGWTEGLTRLHEDIGGSDHFIDVASRTHALEAVVRTAGPTGSMIVKIGCSSGFLPRQLMARLPDHVFLGADYTYGTLETLGGRLPWVPLVQFDLTRCPLPDAFADVVVLLNVLEHIEDDEAAMAELFRIVRPGGAVIIELPAKDSLFDVYDRVLMHHRRYDMPGLLASLRKAGFTIERHSHLGFLLYPLFYLSKRLNQWRYPVGSEVDERVAVSRMISATGKSSCLLGLVMACEREMRRWVSLPFGIRCLVTCRKAREHEQHEPSARSSS